MQDFLDGLYFMALMMIIIVPPLFIKRKGE